MKKQKRRRILLAAVMWVLSLLVILPMVLVILNSLKTPAEADIMSMELPSSLRWENFKVVLTEGRVFSSFLNSAIITVCGVLLSAGLGTMAAFALARNRSRLNKIVHKYFMAGLVLPVQLISLIEVLKGLHLYKDRKSVV